MFFLGKGGNPVGVGVGEERVFAPVGVVEAQADVLGEAVVAQEELEFTLTNSGTEDLRSLSIEVTGSEGLSVLTGRGKVSFLNDGSSLNMTGLRVVATDAGDHTLTVTVTDRDGDVWTSDFTVSAE